MRVAVEVTLVAGVSYTRPSSTVVRHTQPTTVTTLCLEMFLSMASSEGSVTLSALPHATWMVCQNSESCMSA